MDEIHEAAKTQVLPKRKTKNTHTALIHHKKWKP